VDNQWLDRRWRHSCRRSLAV